MGLKLYGMDLSAPVRAVLLCAKALGVELEWISVDLFKGEHMTQEFLAVNPQHTIPMLDDNGFIVVDSHVILSYLVSKYGKDDLLYPEDIKKRAIINQRLHFDSNILYVRGLAISKSLLLEGAEEVSKKQLLALEEAFSITEKLFQNHIYIAGDTMTIADFSIVASITAWSVFLPLSEAKFPKISKWLKTMQMLPYYEECNQRGLDVFTDTIEPILRKLKFI